MQVIFVADQIPEERQWALILVAGGDEAYNRWDTLEETVQDRKKVDQVWDVLNIGSIRIYILTTGVVSNETNTYVRMYIEEFILVEIWIHCRIKLK